MYDTDRSVLESQAFILDTINDFNDLKEQLTSKEYIQYFDYAFEYILQKCYHEFSFSHPRSISKLVSEHLQIKPRDIVYNPIAHLGEFGIDLPGINYIADVALSSSYDELAELRLSAHEIDAELVEDSDEEYDYIVCTPPIGGKAPDGLDTKILGFAPRFTSYEAWAVWKCAQAKKRGACVIPTSFLYSNDKEAVFVRKYVTENLLLECVFSLPPLIQPNCPSIPMSIMVFSNHIGAIRTDAVALIDATSYVKKEGRYTDIDEKTLFDISYDNGNEDILFADSDTLEKENYNLYPLFHKALRARGQIDIPQDCDIVPLNELLQPTGTKLAKGETLPTLSLSSLKSTPLEDSLSAKDLESKESKYGMSMLDKDAIVIAISGSSFKAGLFRADNGPVALSPNIIALSSKSDVVPLEYIFTELFRDYVAKQIPLYGNIISARRKKDIMDVNIIVPNDQRKMLARISEQRKQSSELFKQDVQDIKYELLDNYKKNMHLRKHALGQIIGNMNSSYTMLSSFLKSQPDILHQVVGKRTGKTLEDYLRGLESNLERINNLVDNLTDETHFGEPENIVIEDFWNECKSQFSIPNCILGDVENLSGTNHRVLIDKNSLKQVFENIINNAHSYGFTDPKRNDYVIKVSTNDVEHNGNPAVCIAISNNGSELIDGMSPERIFHWGVGQHTGLGTFQVKEIIEHFGGEVSMKEYKGDVFPICYEIVLPVVED
ncbi:MAG: N-6 DNA methylase [Bacteroidia bacterium]|nr:N-6 DNA methylase [Bacteroidia bacterium]